jgi:hypothetical protein
VLGSAVRTRHRLEDDVRLLTESGGSPIGRVLTDEEQDRLFKVAASNAEWQHVCRAVALPLFQAPTCDVRERRIDGARPIFSSAGARTEPPSGRRETGVAIGRNGGLRFVEGLLHLLIREGLVPLLQAVDLEHQP